MDKFACTLLLCAYNAYDFPVVFILISSVKVFVSRKKLFANNCDRNEKKKIGPAACLWNDEGWEICIPEAIPEMLCEY